MKKNLKTAEEKTAKLNNKGVTLIALVVTIVVLLILALITIDVAFSDEGIFSKAERAQKEPNEAAIKEKVQVMLADAKLKKLAMNTTLKEYLEKEGYEVIENTTSVTIPTEGYDITIDTSTYEITGMYKIDESIIDRKIRNESELKAALLRGGPYTLEDSIILTEPLTVEEGQNVTLNLNGHSISGSWEKSEGAYFSNECNLVIKGGTIENTAINGAATINNAGTMVLDKVNVIGAPIGDNGYPAYTVINSANLTIEEDTTISSDRGALNISGNGETIINGGSFTVDQGDRELSTFVIYVQYNANNKLIINDGSFNHMYSGSTNMGCVVVINCSTANAVEVNGGSFSGGDYGASTQRNLSDYGYGSTFIVTGGTFTSIDTKYVADGYKVTTTDDGLYIVEKE